MNLRDAVFSADLPAIEDTLSLNRGLAIEGLSLPDNPAVASPLHRICDGVFEGYFSEDIGIQMARIFLKNGADVNVKAEPGKDTPLTAACSLRCDKLALLYLDHGADIHHQGCFGGTALHWASWCGRDVVVTRLMTMHPEIDKQCMEYKATPLFWAIHGYQFGGNENRHHQLECARILLDHGADPNIPNFEGLLPAQLAKDNVEIRELFSN